MGDHVDMAQLKVRAVQGRIANMIPRNLRLLRWVHRGGWAVVILADAGDLTNLTPPVPVRVYELALAGCLALTIVATWARSQVPVRAAFLDGMLHERSTADTQLLPHIPMAVGDNVVVMAPASGRHRPSPRQRRP